MMNSERDKFLTEAMGECWHEPAKPPKCIPEIRLGVMPRCGKCGTALYSLSTPFKKNEWPSYDAWEDFGKLWEWAQKQEWFTDFIALYHKSIPHRMHEETVWINKLFHPDRFANALYNFLKEANP